MPYDMTKNNRANYDFIVVWHLRHLISATVLLAIVLGFIPLAHATPPPGIPVLYISSQGGPYVSGETAQIQFKLQNVGPDTINGLTLDLKAGQGWSVLSGSVNIGTVGSGQQVTFSAQANIGNSAFPSIVFTARSNDHITLDFPVSIFVSTPVTARMIANPGEQINPLLNILYQGVTYAVDQIGNIYFPTTQSGITSSAGLSDVLQGYFIHSYLGDPSNANLASLIASITNELASIISDTGTVQSQGGQSYTFSIGSFSYTNLLYQFLTWQIPLSQLTGGLIQDRGIPDLIAWAIQQYSGQSVSANDIIELANILLQLSSGSLGRYASDAAGLGQLIQRIMSTATPDTDSLMQAMSHASQIASELSAAAQVLNSLLGVIQNVINWVRNLAQQIDQVFQSLMTWISNNIPLISGAINNFLSWLYNSLKAAIYDIVDIFDKSTQAQPPTQTSQNIVAGMSNWVQQYFSTASSNLQNRLSQVADQASQTLNSYCRNYEQALPLIKSITPWVGTLVGFVTALGTQGALNPSNVVPGMVLLENTADGGCSYTTTGADPITVIAQDYGANNMLGNMFSNEEGMFHSIGNLLNYLGVSTPAVNRLIGAMSSSGFDLSAVSGILSNYQSAISNGNSAYQSANYIGALTTLASLTDLPSLGAIETVLQEVEPCANVQTKFQQYSQEGMVAPDLQTQTQGCQQGSQAAISAIASGDYSALAKAAGLSLLASQIDSALETRHQQFILAKSALEQLSSAVSSLSGCGFMWVQPDRSAVDQANHALQQTQTQYAAGQYADVLNTAKQGTISQVQTTGHVCSLASNQAKMEVGGGLGVAIVAALSGFAYFRKGKPKLRSKSKD